MISANLGFTDTTFAVRLHCGQSPFNRNPQWPTEQRGSTPGRQLAVCPSYELMPTLPWVVRNWLI